MKLDYSIKGSFGEMDDVRVICNKPQSVKIWAGDPVFSVYQVSIDVDYWFLLIALIKSLPKMLWNKIRKSK